MKALRFTGLILLLIFGVAFYAVFAPTRGRSLGVSISSRGFQTNAAGQVVPTYAITNHSKRAVLIVPAVERRPAPALVVIDMLGNMQRSLAAHSEVIVVISNAPPERAAVHCQREVYFTDRAGTAKRLFDTYLFCRKEVELVYAQ
jgi:hypothetical protein